MSPITSRILLGLLPAVTGALLLAPPAAANDDVVLIQFLSSTGEDGNGTARARWRDKGDSLDFSVELEQMDQGSYDLFVADVQQGTIDVDGSSEGEIEFKTPLDSPKPLFDFDVFDQTIEVRQGGTVFFSDVFSPGGDGGSGGGGGGGGGKSKTEVFMVNVGPDGNAKGRLRYETKSNEIRFQVNVEHLDAGEYDLVVGGTTVATFDTTGLPEVELQFRDPADDSPSDEPGEIKFELTFDPLGRQVDVVAGETTYLTGVLPGTASSGSPSKAKQASKDLGKKKGDALSVQLFDLGVLAGAKGKMKLAQGGETEFEVEIEHVQDGTYALFVGGLERGTLSVTAGEGQLEFSTSPGDGQLTLDFEVKGELVEVKLGEDAILANVFPISVQSALGTFKKESSSETKVVRNLINAGADLDARGRLQWTLKKNGRERLVVTVQDLLAGEYAILVDDVERGTLTITKDDGGAKVVFDTQSGGSKLPLEFDVLGSVVTILDGETTLLAATIE